MLQQNFYPGKAIQVWNNNDGGTSKQDDADIPNPSYLVEELSGTTTGLGNAVLVDATATFQDDLAANKFAIGDTVYQPDTYKHSRIVSVDSQTQLTVFNATFFPAVFAATAYQIYRKSPYGCILLIDNLVAKDPLEVTDLNNNVHVLTQGEAAIKVLPFQVRKLVHGKTDGKGTIFALFQ
tara:strand:- start:2988 stop:3527 length:540 start_codon:yes stop_codon:yes gene_type:complete